MHYLFLYKLFIISSSSVIYIVKFDGICVHTFIIVISNESFSTLYCSVYFRNTFITYLYKMRWQTCQTDDKT